MLLLLKLLAHLVADLQLFQNFLRDRVNKILVLLQLIGKGLILQPLVVQGPLGLLFVVPQDGLVLLEQLELLVIGAQLGLESVDLRIPLFQPPENFFPLLISVEGADILDILSDVGHFLRKAMRLLIEPGVDACAW